MVRRNIKHETSMKLKYPTTYTVFDLETTGLDPGNDRILEVAVLDVQDGITVNEYSQIINHGPDFKIPPQATAIHGITDEMCASEGLAEDVVLMKLMVHLAKSGNVVSHNGIRFDMQFVLNSLTRIFSVDQVEHVRLRLILDHIDTAMLIKGSKAGIQRHWNESFYDYARRVGDTRSYVKFNLALCCDELGIDRSSITAHRAAADCALTNEVYKKLLLS